MTSSVEGLSLCLDGGCCISLYAVSISMFDSDVFFENIIVA